MDEKTQKRSVRYFAVAFLVGMAWPAVLLVSPSMRGVLLQPDVASGAAFLALFPVTSCLLAAAFRRWIVSSRRLMTDALLAIVLPGIGACFVSLGYVFLAGVTRGWPASSQDLLWAIVLFPWYGLLYAYGGAWYAVLPMGVMSQMIMKRVGRLAI